MTNDPSGNAETYITEHLVYTRKNVMDGSAFPNTQGENFEQLCMHDVLDLLWLEQIAHRSSDPRSR